MLRRKGQGCVVCSASVALGTRRHESLPHIKDQDLKLCAQGLAFITHSVTTETSRKYIYVCAFICFVFFLNNPALFGVWWFACNFSQVIDS